MDAPATAYGVWEQLQSWAPIVWGSLTALSASVMGVGGLALRVHRAQVAEALERQAERAQHEATRDQIAALSRQLQEHERTVQDALIQQARLLAQGEARDTRLRSHSHRLRAVELHPRRD